MKKVAVFFYLLFISLFILHAQTDTAKIYETFFWEPVSSAKKYEVIIERQKDDSWEPYHSSVVKECSFEYLFEPDIYRIGIVSVNALGRKSKEISWLKFKVLDEKVPYLYALNLNNLWNSPVLYIKNNLELPDPNDVYIVNEPSMPENSFCLKGKNIFYEDTSFTLIPIEKSLFNGKDFPDTKPGRKSVTLEIIQRNSKNNTVNLSYQSKLLKSGYYKLEVKNPGGYTAELSILVLTKESLAIKPLETEYNEKYEVNTLERKKDVPLEINLKGEGFSDETKFYLEPSEGKISYPLEEIIEKERVELVIKENINSEDSEDNGVLLTQSETALLKTGHYNIVAENPDGQKQSIPVLIEAAEDDKNKPDFSVDKVSVKLNASKGEVDLSFTGKNLDEDFNYVLVSQYFENIENNEKIKIKPTITKNGKLAKSTLPLNHLPVGKYVLLIESNDDLQLVCFEIDQSFNSKLFYNTPEQIDSWIKPSPKNTIIAKENVLEKANVENNTKEDTLEEKLVDSTEEEPISVENQIETANKIDNDNNSEIGINWDKSFIVTDHQYILTLLPDYYFNTMLFSLDFNSESISRFGGNIGYNLEYNLVDLPWFDTGAFLRFNPEIVGGVSFNPVVSAGAFLDFRLPFFYLSPSVGFAGGYSFLDGLSKGSLLKNDLFATARLGVTLFDCIDFKYSLELHNINSLMYFRDDFSLGFKFKIKPKKYLSELGLRDVLITRPGVLDGKDYENDIAFFNKIVTTDGITELSNLSSKNLKSISISSSVRKINDRAFANCMNLENIEIRPYISALEEIGEEAFANCNKIRSINIPESVRRIGKNAFDGWNPGQTINLGWIKEDAGERDLSGLENTMATILDKNGNDYFTGETPNILMGGYNWKHRFTNGMTDSFFEDEYLYENGQFTHYLKALMDVDKTYSYRTAWKDVQLSSEMLEGIRNSDGIEFTFRNTKYSEKDKNIFVVLLVTSFDGVFVYPFEASVSNNPSRREKHIVAHFDDFVPTTYSETKILDTNEILYYCIVPNWSVDAYESMHHFEYFLKDIYFLNKE